MGRKSRLNWQDEICYHYTPQRRMLTSVPKKLWGDSVVCKVFAPRSHGKFKKLSTVGCTGVPSTEGEDGSSACTRLVRIPVSKKKNVVTEDRCLRFPLLLTPAWTDTFSPIPAQTDTFSQAHGGCACTRSRVIFWVDSFSLGMMQRVPQMW
jgi:hypothetical protein